MNNSVYFNKRCSKSLTRSFRQCFIRLFLLISCKPPNATALPSVLASPGWQHVLSWVKSCTTAAQLCFLNSAASHFDIETSRALYPLTLQLPLLPRAVSAATGSRLGSNFTSTSEPHTHFSTTANSPQKPQLFDPHTSHLSTRYTNSCASLP